MTAEHFRDELIAQERSSTKKPSSKRQKVIAPRAFEVPTDPAPIAADGSAQLQKESLPASVNLATLGLPIQSAADAHIENVLPTTV